MRQDAAARAGWGGEHMRVLVAHNFYQHEGGEEQVVKNERQLLQDAGHDYHFYCEDNEGIVDLTSKIAAFRDVAYSAKSRAKFEQVLTDIRPDVVHVHNYFPLITPSIFYACKARGVPVVHTLHNYRIACASGVLMRNGKVCEKCLGGSPLWGVAHRCYRGSLVGSIATARMIGAQQRKGTWQTQVDRFIALTQFERDKFIQAGVPEDRMVIKPNFIADPDVHKSHAHYQRQSALFVGRLSPEKGLRSLLEAWRNIDYPLRIVGDGPMLEELQRTAPPHVTVVGRLPNAEVHAEMGRAAFLVMPSTWYEGFPVTLVEALACGLPVLASRIGSLEELIEEGRTGRLFTPDDADDIRRAVETVRSNPSELAAMSGAARALYEARYSAEANLAQLIAIYEAARDESAVAASIA